MAFMFDALRARVRFNVADNMLRCAKCGTILPSSGTRFCSASCEERWDDDGLIFDDPYP